VEEEEEEEEEEEQSSSVGRRRGAKGAMIDFRGAVKSSIVD
jgi:hypothetical protein